MSRRWSLVYFRDERSGEVSGREERSTEQIRRLFARYRESARGVTAVSEDAVFEGERDEAPDKVPATVGG
jgi:hypothetical protein